MVFCESGGIRRKLIKTRESIPTVMIAFEVWLVENEKCNSEC